MHHAEAAVKNSQERYHVTFTYAEPSYARARGISELAYLAGFEVSAADPNEAIMLATDLFHEAQRRSGVSWARVILTSAWRLI